MPGKTMVAIGSMALLFSALGMFSKPHLDHLQAATIASAILLASGVIAYAIETKR